jgi:hypothetical protein
MTDLNTLFSSSLQNSERKVEKCYVRFREPLSRKIDITFLMAFLSLFLIFSSLSGP